MCLTECILAGLVETQKRIGELRGKWDSRHAFLREQQHEASVIVKSLVSPRILRSSRHLAPMGQNVEPLGTSESSSRPGRLCVVTSFAGSGNALRQTTIYPDALFHIDNAELSLSHSWDALRRDPHFPLLSANKVQPSNPSLSAGPKLRLAKIECEITSCGVVQRCSPRSRKDAPVAVPSSNWSERGTSVSMPQVKPIANASNETERLTPKGAQPSSRGGVTVWSHATHSDWSLRSGVSTGDASQAAGSSRGTIKKNSNRNSPRVSGSSSICNSRVSSGHDARGGAMGPMTALKQLRKEVSNIDFSLQGIRHTTWGARPDHPSEWSSENEHVLKRLHQMPAASVKPKGSWVLRMSHLRDTAARPDVITASTSRQLGVTKEFVTGWSSERHYVRDKICGAEGAVTMGSPKSKLHMAEWVKVCDTYPVSPRRLASLTGIGSDSRATMIELGPMLGGQRRQVDLSVDNASKSSDQEHTSSLPLASANNQSLSRFPEGITTPRGMARAVVQPQIQGVEVACSENLAHNLGESFDDSAKSPMPSGLEVVGGALSEAVVFVDEKTSQSTDLQIPSRAITGNTAVTTATAATPATASSNTTSALALD